MRKLISTSAAGWIACGVFLLCFGGTRCAAEADWNAGLPAGRAMIADQPLRAFSLSGKQMDLGQLKIVDVKGPGFDRALELQTMPGATGEWNVEAVAPVNGEVKRGDVLLADFWLRCSTSMTAEGYTTFCFELNHPDFAKAALFRISAEKRWREVFVPFVSPRDFPAGEARVCFWLGYDRQVVEVGGLTVTNYERSVKLDQLPETKVSYRDRDPDAAWRKEALSRIEKIRKGDLDVTVTDAQGQPLAGAQVHAVLKRHAFGFGTCVDADLLVSDSPDAQRYKQTILQLFNRAVFENEMKWQATWNGVSPDVDKALDWLLANGIEVRGHNLVWPGWQWLPRELRQYENDPAKLREVTAKHITYMVSHFRGKLIDWDVVNEPFSNYDLIQLLGGKSIMVEWYKLAHAADPNCRLFLNDFGILDGGPHNEHREDFYNNIRYLLANGAPLGGIGIQSHFGTELPEPTDILKILDRFAKFNLPIESTELSINLHDRQLQADYLRDYMIALFSHPNVQDIMLWGFWQRRHWRPEAGIFADDWTIRPAGQVFIDLTQKQWSTDATATAGDGGQATIRGFYGTYEVTVSAGGKTRTVSTELNRGGSHLSVRMN
jgi:GH35 family endo-1,4-beta-xylanase